VGSGGRSIALGGAAALIAVAAAACGGGGASAGAPSGSTHSTATATASGWRQLQIPTGASLPYPSGWHLISGDPGSAAAALFDRNGLIRAYLNVTPAVAKEQLGSWARFRIGHNADEGDRNVRLLSSQTNIRNGADRESCVTDTYTTTKTSYHELACLVQAPHGPRTVLVAAAQPPAWPRERAAFQYAFNHFQD
jgi:hypothetical protein